MYVYIYITSGFFSLISIVCIFWAILQTLAEPPGFAQGERGLRARRVAISHRCIGENLSKVSIWDITPLYIWDIYGIYLGYMGYMGLYFCLYGIYIYICHICNMYIMNDIDLRKLPCNTNTVLPHGAPHARSTVNTVFIGDPSSVWVDWVDVWPQIGGFFLMNLIQL